MTVVNCPTCAAKVEWTEANKFRPFCSERCKQIDLGAWAEEKYRSPPPTRSKIRSRTKTTNRSKPHLNGFSRRSPCVSKLSSLPLTTVKP